MTNEVFQEPVFLPELDTVKPRLTAEGREILRPANTLTTELDAAQTVRSEAFTREIEAKMVTDFKKPGDKMVHVSTFVFIGDRIYMTYYANVSTGEEDPRFQRARLVHCPIDNPEDKTYLDVQAAGDTFAGKHVDAVYDTILMRLNDEVLTILWTANLSGNYYRLYRTYTIATGELGPIGVNRLKVGEDVVDFSFSGIQNIFTANGIPVKTMYSDIGIMQKQSVRVEDGVPYVYSGAYSGDLNFLMKSKDLVTWEYVAQPDFVNQSKWENAVYVWGDKCYYFVRQHDTSPYSFLTCYDLVTKAWADPVLVPDCQSRGDFIEYNGRLYLFHAPIDREHIGVLQIDTDNLAHTRVVFQAKMHESCFYPFLQYGGDGGLYMSYTSARQHIRLAGFDANAVLR